LEVDRGLRHSRLDRRRHQRPQRRAAVPPSRPLQELHHRRRHADGAFQFVTSFSLPLYAIVGAQKGVEVGLPVLGVLALAVIGPTAGRWYVDVSCDVPPKQFIRGEWFVSIALLTGLVWVACDAAGLNTWVSAAVSFVVGYTVRVLAL
jgi:uncharacterized membrane protein YeiH